jgi:hypothetical protein
MVSEPYASLPEFVLRESGPASEGLLRAGCQTFHNAANHIWQLAYGRTRNRDEMLVLGEGKGTCSTKHALLARCAREHQQAAHGVPGGPGEGIELLLAMFLMTESYAPRLAPLLQGAGIDGFPEAHCLLRSRGRFVDLTHPGIQTTWTKDDFLAYETIEPEEVADYKPAYHRMFVDNWALRHHSGLGGDEIWRLRESCIEALSGG